MKGSNFANAKEPILARYPEHAKQIGVLITNWNTIEQTLVIVLALSFGNGRGSDLIHPMLYALRNSSARLDVMEPALLASFERLKIDGAELVSILQEAGKVLNARNTYAHSVYSDDKGKLRMINLEDGLWGDALQKQKNNRPVHLHEIEDAVKRSQNLSNRVLQLMVPIAEKRLRESRASAKMKSGGND